LTSADTIDLSRAVGAKYLVVLPEGYREGDAKGTVLQPYELDSQQWKRLCTGMDQLAHQMAEDYDLQLVFHPHADSHIDVSSRVVRFLEQTDPTLTNLCLDTGHISYCGGDNIDLILTFPGRIKYVHLKQVDPEVIREVNEQGLSFAEAVRRGAVVEPHWVIPAMEPLLAGLDADLVAIVEQDMYPCSPDAPLPIAKRTQRYFGGCGLSLR
jgi:inosose dehydratase